MGACWGKVAARFQKGSRLHGKKVELPVIEGEFTEVSPPKTRWFQTGQFWIYMVVIAALAMASAGSITGR